MKHKIILFLSALSLTGCYNKDDKEELNIIKNNNIEKILDKNFAKISDKVDIKSNDHKMFSPIWRVKTSITDGIEATLRNTKQGLEIISSFTNYGYLYLRQIIPDIYQFENRTIKMKIIYDNIYDNNLRYDIYIQSRFISDNATRILVTDTKTKKFNIGSNLIIEETFKIPNFEKNYNLDLDNTEGLSVAFRLINDKEEITKLLIKEISVQILVEE